MPKYHEHDTNRLQDFGCFHQCEYYMTKPDVYSAKEKQIHFMTVILICKWQHFETVTLIQAKKNPKIIVYIGVSQHEQDLNCYLIS